jgi:hypothetical protein
MRAPFACRTLLAVAFAGLAVPALADRALVVGVDAYADPKLAIGGRSSSRDVAAIVSLLKGDLGYRPDDIAVLADGEASRAAILDKFQTWLIDGSKPGDRVFFYFSGLGYFQKDENGDEPDGLDETLVPADATVGAGDPPTIDGMISDDELAVLMKKLDGRKLTVAVDAGTSGIVTRGGADKPSTDPGFRVAALGGKTRSIVIEPSAKAQKAEGAPLDTAGLPPDTAVFTAASGGQSPVIADGEGAFTKAFVDSMKDKGADANHNGIVSNAEILAFLRDKSKTACADQSGCDLGLTPTLEPAGSAGGSPLAGPPQDGKLTADQVLDFFAKGNGRGVLLEQIPPSPVKVGTRDIRFRVTSPAEGNLVLLDLGDDGTLTQLFPNQFAKGGGREGRILAGSPIVVPDDYYGIRFNATSPTSGTLIALVTTEPIVLPPSIKTRSIEVIPRTEAKEVVLPALAAALEAPADADKDSATRGIDWSVATLRYEIVK